jgi:hypothetical protein
MAMRSANFRDEKTLLGCVEAAGENWNTVENPAYRGPYAFHRQLANKRATCNLTDRWYQIKTGAN